MQCTDSSLHVPCHCSAGPGLTPHAFTLLQKNNFLIMPCQRHFHEQLCLNSAQLTVASRSTVTTAQVLLWARCPSACHGQARTGQETCATSVPLYRPPNLRVACPCCNHTFFPQKRQRHCLLPEGHKDFSVSYYKGKKPKQLASSVTSSPFPQ